MYVSAREELIRRETVIDRQYRQRITDLHDAAVAQQRAIELLQQQDGIILQSIGVDVWQLLGHRNNRKWVDE